jgi:acylphosphatase
MAEIALHLRVTGRVQGVGYRAWCRAEAQALGLRGRVRNRDDGSVEVLVAGEEDRVRQLVTAMGEGPGAARVTDVWPEPADPATVPPGFQITG